MFNLQNIFSKLFSIIYLVNFNLIRWYLKSKWAAIAFDEHSNNDNNSNDALNYSSKFLDKFWWTNYACVCKWNRVGQGGKKER